MNFYRHNWYYVGTWILVILGFIVGIYSRYWEPLLPLMVFSWMALLAHQFEEYAVPGGFPAVFNITVLGEREVPERHPLNANQCLWTNVILSYPIYLAGIIWWNTIWLGLIITLAGMMQLVVHGLITNIRLKSLYNAGLGTTVFLFLPIGIYYWWYVATNGMTQWYDYIIAVIGAIAVAGGTILLPIRLIGSKDSPYPFNEREMSGYGARRAFATISAAHNSR